MREQQITVDLDEIVQLSEDAQEMIGDAVVSFIEEQIGIAAENLDYDYSVEVKINVRKEEK